MPMNISRRAGIGRQLHPIKPKDVMKDKAIEIEWKNDMGVNHINQKLFKLRIQSFYSNASQHVIGALEMVVNCIP